MVLELMMLRLMIVSALPGFHLEADIGQMAFIGPGPIYGPIYVYVYVYPGPIYVYVAIQNALASMPLAPRLISEADSKININRSTMLI
jgi:hypothetical protein